MAGSDAIYCGCGRVADLVDGVEIYPHRADDMLGKLFYICRPCKAWTGVNLSTGLPHGALGDEETRKARRDAHKALQAIVERKVRKEGVTERRAMQLATGWLSQRLGIPREQARISAMDAETARKVAAMCSPYALRRA